MPNICRAIHLPAQSGASSMLARMNRKYTRRMVPRPGAAIRRYLPDCAVTTDLIAGFSGETEEEHAATLSLMREVGYEFAYMFKYSERPGTYAHKHLPDDVPEEVKSARLAEIIALQNELSRAGATCATWGADSKCWSRERPARREPNFRAVPRRTRSWSSTAAATASATMCGSASRAALPRRFRRRKFQKDKIKIRKCDLTNLSWRMRSSTDSYDMNFQGR